MASIYAMAEYYMVGIYAMAECHIDDKMADNIHPIFFM